MSVCLNGYILKNKKGYVRKPCVGSLTKPNNYLSSDASVVHRSRRALCNELNRMCVFSAAYRAENEKESTAPFCSG